MNDEPRRPGPLAHLTVLEFAGLGPAPFAAMMLADQGARVIRIDRPPRQGGGGLSTMTARRADLLARGRESIALDLKRPAAIDIVRRLVQGADALIEGFRPGVMESLGLGPQVCLDLRPSLVYTRATGWGQSGPMAQAAGHDINYTALSGALHVNGRAGQPPTPGAGLIGDFGGGGMLAAFGTVTAVLAARQTGQGQVVDAAACEGSALLATLLYGWRSAGLWNAETGTNMGDGGAPFYNTYACADGRHIAVGAIEPPFYALLRERCGLDDPAFDAQWDQRQWPELGQRMAALFRQRTRDQWCELLEGNDACFAPVLDLDEAPAHPHHHARSAFATVDGVPQPAPAPKFSATPAPTCSPVHPEGSHTRALLAALGMADDEVDGLIDAGVAYAAGVD